VKPEHSLQRSEHIGVFSIYNARKFPSILSKQIEVFTIYPPTASVRVKTEQARK